MSIALPPPVIRKIKGVNVIDDSGFADGGVGTKLRMALELVSNSHAKTFNFASSPFGESPLAMAQACIQLKRRLNLFYPRVPEDQYTDQMKAARDMGARIITLDGTEDHEYVQAEAQSERGKFISFDTDDAVAIVTRTAKELHVDPSHVWAAGGLGGITRGLQEAWKGAEHHVVAVNKRLKEADYGDAEVYYTSTAFRKAAGTKTPFPCNVYFEAKAWAKMRRNQQGQENVYFWNPAAR